jgi:hypothetical protein
MPIITIPEYPKNMPTAEHEQKALNILELRKQALIKQKENTILTCPCCNNQQLVKETTHITNLWYEEPYGCTGGAEYHDSEGEDQFICIKCGEHTRLPEDWNSKKGKFSSGHGKYFKERKDKFEGRLSNRT